MSENLKLVPTQQVSTLSATLAWFNEARPAPTNKQFHTQTGVHFEEVGEMIDEISGLNTYADVLLGNARVALRALADYLKAESHVITVKPEDRIDFLDALSDQIVTATGVGQHLKFLMVEAMDEVNASNFSKFVDGKAIYTDPVSQKIGKGPDYFKASLGAFVPARSPALDD